MDNSNKRPRLEVTSSSTATPTTSHLQHVASSSSSTAESYLLAEQDDELGGSNVLLTICDERSEDNSEDYLQLDESALAQLKQEAGLEALPLQYRIVNSLRGTPLATLPSEEVTTTTTAAILPAALQLPSGCDIYLVKEYVSASDGSTMQQQQQQPQVLRKAVPAPAREVVDMKPSINVPMELNNKRSFVLESYKKRDDKRRATHNEVERRRRDKINSWIFKLKEMLPEMPINMNCMPQSKSAEAQTSNNNSYRTPPSDSKSQILIKACEYIKSMQDELKSLRECLKDHEQLRTSNQRLQQELEELKQERQSSHTLSINDSFSSSRSCSPKTLHDDYANITLNSLNNTKLNYHHAHKRELIIRDYVD